MLWGAPCGELGRRVDRALTGYGLDFSGVGAVEEEVLMVVTEVFGCRERWCGCRIVLFLEGFGLGRRTGDVGEGNGAFMGRCTSWLG